MVDGGTARDREVGENRSRRNPGRQVRVHRDVIDAGRHRPRRSGPSLRLQIALGTLERAREHELLAQDETVETCAAVVFRLGSDRPNGRGERGTEAGVGIRKDHDGVQRPAVLTNNAVDTQPPSGDMGFREARVGSVEHREQERLAQDPRPDHQAVALRMHHKDVGRLDGEAAVQPQLATA